MKTLTELGQSFAQLDAIQGDELRAYEKAVKNLTQWHNLAPADARGRTFLYDASGATALRLVQVAYQFGLDRIARETLTRFLRPEMMREAIQRTNDGETFSVHLIFGTDQRYRCETDWAKEPVSPRVEHAIVSAGFDHAPEMARFTLPASRLIADVLPTFEAN